MSKTHVTLCGCYTLDCNACETQIILRFVIAISNRLSSYIKRMQKVLGTIASRLFLMVTFACTLSVEFSLHGNLYVFLDCNLLYQNSILSNRKV